MPMSYLSRRIYFLLIALCVLAFSFPQGAQGQWGLSDAEQRQSRNMAIDSRYFWTALDSTLVSNEFELFSKIPFDYASLKPSQEGMLVLVLLVSPNGKVLDYGVQSKPDGIKDLAPFAALLPRIRLTTPQGRDPFTPEFSQKIGKNFYYFLFWPVYKHLPHGTPVIDEDYARFYNYFVLRTNKGGADYNRLVQVDSPAEPIKLNSWKNSVAFPQYGLDAEISGEVKFEVVVDTLGRVIKHRLFPQTHAVYVYMIMQKLYKLKFIPAKQDGKPVLAINRFNFSFTVR
jgi:hypothetical protein